MKIEAIKLKNFKSFKDAQMLEIPRFCVIVGANGTGKSTLKGIMPKLLPDAMTFRCVVFEGK